MATDADGHSRNQFAGNRAKDHARQHNGNVFNNYEKYYNLRQRRSDETLREDGRNKALITAASEGQTPRVKHLLQLGAEVDHTDEYGLTALHHAALSGFHDTAVSLLNAGADVNAVSLDCGTPLHLAALKGRSDVVQLLLNSRADVSRRSRLLGTPLHCAAFTGDLAVVQDLCSRGADVNRLEIVRLSLLDSIRAAGSFVPTPRKARYYLLGPAIESVQCHPWHMAFLGGSDSALAISRLTSVDSNLLSEAWNINFVQDHRSDMTAIHRIEQLSILNALVEQNRPEVLESLVTDNTKAVAAYTWATSYGAICAAVLQDRFECAEMLLTPRFRSRVNERDLIFLADRAESNKMRELILKWSKSSPPVYPKVHRDYMSAKVLKYYELPWEYDDDDPSYMIILREMDPSELDVLFEATAKLRSGKWNPKRRGGPFRTTG